MMARLSFSKSARKFVTAAATFTFCVAGCGGDSGPTPDSGNTPDVMIPVDTAEVPDQSGSTDTTDRDLPNRDNGTKEDHIVTVDTDSDDDASVSDEGSGQDENTVETVPYGQCLTDSDCNTAATGLECLTFPDGRYGYCTKGCTTDEECAASTAGNPAGCYKEDGKPDGTCVSYCGVPGQGAQCQAWLECVSSQFCLPPSTTVASKETGEACTGPAECLSGECIEGQNTRAHCAGKCLSNDDCKGPEGNWSGTCTAAGGLSYNFCIYMCGMMAAGAVCPGDLECVGMSVCQ